MIMIMIVAVSMAVVVVMIVIRGGVERHDLASAIGRGKALALNGFRGNGRCSSAVWRGKSRERGKTARRQGKQAGKPSGGMPMCRGHDRAALLLWARR